MQKINSLKIGLITGFTMIALELIFFYGLKRPFDSPLLYVIYMVYLLGIIWSIIEFKKSANFDPTFKDYFSAGFKTFILVTLLMVIYTIIFLKINPQILEEKISENKQLALQEGNHTLDEIEANAKQMRSVFITIMAAITTFMYLFLGTLITAVTAGAILQLKKK